MWQSTFLPRNRIRDIFGQHYSKINFCDIRATVFFNHTWSCRVVAYRKQRTKEYIKFLAQTVVAVALEIKVVVTCERVFETVFDWETKGLFVKRSLTGGGRFREVVAMRELTIFELRSKGLYSVWMKIIAVIYATFAVAKRKPEKNSGLYGIRTLDLSFRNCKNCLYNWWFVKGVTNWEPA